MTFSVPTVDVSPYISDPSSAAAKDIIDTIRAACLNTGFFQIIGHGIPKETQKGILRAAKNLYDLPMEEKRKLDYTKNIGHKGYAIIGSQGYDDELLPDLKESFLIGHDNHLDEPRVVARRFFMGPNIWPPLPDPEFKEPVNEYFTAIYDLTITILQIIAYTLPYGPNVFSNFIANDPAVPLRLLHYPPQTISSEKQLGASAHTDFGAITLLLQDENAGLEVKDEETGEWCLLPPREDAFVVNIGDMLSMWTEGMYKSSVHRVLNKGGRDRYSVAFFFDGNLDCKLEPLGGGKGERKEAMTCEQYMVKRMTETYGGGK